jgi:hypothetical protein
MSEAACTFERHQHARRSGRWRVAGRHGDHALRGSGRKHLVWPRQGAARHRRRAHLKRRSRQPSFIQAAAPWGDGSRLSHVADVGRRMRFDGNGGHAFSRDVRQMKRVVQLKLGQMPERCS